jgi:serine phosphatase RsbU (regulator of sigma subunit)
MAMIKSAIDTLVQERHPPDRIFASLDRLVRAQAERRSFVTATLTLIDVEQGTAEITNAGHPPTYLLRDGEIDEILLPGTPLGTLDGRYGRRRISLEPDDVLIWLSDGFIEAFDDGDEAFGYERTIQALGGDAESASAVRDRLLAAVREHAGGRAADDDRTLVVVRYLGRSVKLEPQLAEAERESERAGALG